MTEPRPSDPRFPHFMLQEIYDQPRAVMEAVQNYLSPELQPKTLGEVHLSPDEIAAVRRISLIASGASRHAALAGEYMLERLAALPVEVDFASQYALRDALVGEGELIIALSQSGTTADTLAALTQAESRGAKTIAIVNVPGSPIARQADGVLYTHAGVEHSIAATKSFTAQLVALYALAVHLGAQRRTQTSAETRSHLDAMMSLPEKLEATLQTDALCKHLGKQLARFDTFMFLGRDISYSIALEGALKLKETSYIHAEGYPTGEFRHGPAALVDEQMPIVMIATRDPKDPGSCARFEKSLVNLKEILSRGTRALVIASSGADQVRALTPDVIEVPQAGTLLSPVLEIVPLQLFAYHIAVERGVNVDRPRNLTKSVTTD